MSAQSAKVYEFPNSERAAQARPVHKLRVLEHVRRLVLEDQREQQRWKVQNAGVQKPKPTFLTQAAMNVVQYLAEITDKETGFAIVEVATIAERVGYSRPTIVRQLKRLVEVGVIEREAHRKGKRCYASFYRLLDPGSPENRPRFTDEPTPVHQRTTYARGLKTFPHGLNPRGGYRGGQPPEISSGGLRGQMPSNEPTHHAPVEPTGPPRSAQQYDAHAPSSAFDWIDLAEWLATEGKYRRWGSRPGEAYELAKGDLDEWRERCGDRAMLTAIGLARDVRLFGDNLIDFLRNTRPRGRDGFP